MPRAGFIPNGSFLEKDFVHMVTFLFCIFRQLYMFSLKWNCCVLLKTVQAYGIIFLITDGDFFFFFDKPDVKKKKIFPECSTSQKEFFVRQL